MVTRRLLNFPPPTHAPNVQLYMEQYPLGEIQKRLTPTYGTTEKIPTSKQVGKAEKLHRKSHSQHNDIQLEGKTQLPASPWGKRGLDPTSSSPTLKTSTRQKAPNHLALRVSEAFIQGSRGTLANKAAWRPAQDSVQKAGKNAHFPVSFQGSDGITHKLLRKSPASNQRTSRWWPDPSQSLSELVSTCPSPHSGALPTIKISLQFLPGRSLSTYLVLWLLQQSSDLVQRANRTCTESHRTTANKEAVFQPCRSTSIPLQPYPRGQHRDSRQVLNSQFLPGRRLTAYCSSHCLRVQLLISLHHQGKENQNHNKISPHTY